MNAGRMRIPFFRLQDVLLWLLVLLAFAPSLRWLIGVAATSVQVRDAAIILGLALLYLVRDGSRRARLVFRMGPRALAFVAAACALAAAAGIFHVPAATVVALGLLAGGVLLYVAGDGMLRPAAGLSVAFSLLTVLAALFPLADAPLRAVAGLGAKNVLDFAGAPADLLLAGNPPKIYLLSAGQIFEVATECNGFGLFSSSLLMATLLAFALRIRVAGKAALLVAAPLLGLASNILRIVLIVVLAPKVGAANYNLLHEAVGISLFLSTLAAIWILARALTARETDQTKSDIS